MSTEARSDHDLLQAAYRQARGLGLVREDAQDCAQEFLVRLLAKPSARNEPLVWINRCAHNFACNYLRGLARRRATERRALEAARTNGSRSCLTPSTQPGPKTILLRQD